MFLTHETNDRFIKIITCNLNGLSYYCAAKGDNSDIGCTATDINDHVAARLADIDTCADCCCYRLFNDLNISCACCVGSIFNSSSLNFSSAGRNADTDHGLAQSLASNCLADEILEHLLGYRVIRDNALAKRSDGYDIAGCTADHKPCFFTNRLNLTCIAVKSYN